MKSEDARSVAIESAVVDFVGKLIQANATDAEIKWRVARALTGALGFMIAEQARAGSDLETGILMHANMLKAAAEHFFSNSRPEPKKVH